MTAPAISQVPVSDVDAGRPVRFADPARNSAYWARIDRIVDQAPPLTLEQRAVIRSAFHTPAIKEVAA